MKKHTIAVQCAVVLALLAAASADVSQEDAANICRPYSSDGETINIVGPVICDGEYWICGFVYYGNSQNVMLAINTDTGKVLSDTDLLEDIIATYYAMDSGSYVFSNVLTEQNFALQMAGMNTTLSNNKKILENLKKEKYITQQTYINLTEGLDKLGEQSSNLAQESSLLMNISTSFDDAPSCVGMMSYIDDLNKTLVIALNFSGSWGDFIKQYNVIASGITEVYVATISSSDTELLKNSLSAIGPDLEEFNGGKGTYTEGVLSNIKTRIERKDAKDVLDEAYSALKDSTNEKAQEKYNDASEAFSAGEYIRAKRLAREALTIPDEDGNKNPPEVIVEKAPDYTIYFIAIGLLLGIILIATMIKRRGESGESDEDLNRDERPKREKPLKKGNWAWIKERESSMERASRGPLDT